MKDYQRLFRQAYENLKPGGWFEVADATVGVFCDDESIERAPNLLEWRDRLIEASGKFGKQMGVSPRYKHWMINAGFTEVTEEVYKVSFYLPIIIPLSALATITHITLPPPCIRSHTPPGQRIPN